MFRLAVVRVGTGSKPGGVSLGPFLAARPAWDPSPDPSRPTPCRAACSRHVTCKWCWAKGAYMHYPWWFCGCCAQVNYSLQGATPGKRQNAFGMTPKMQHTHTGTRSVRPYGVGIQQPPTGRVPCRSGGVGGVFQVFNYLREGRPPPALSGCTNCHLGPPPCKCTAQHRALHHAGVVLGRGYAFPHLHGLFLRLLCLGEAFSTRIKLGFRHQNRTQDAHSHPRRHPASTSLQSGSRAQCGGRNPAAAPRAGLSLSLIIIIGPNPPALPPPGGTASIVPATTLLSLLHGTTVALHGL